MYDCDLNIHLKGIEMNNRNVNVASFLVAAVASVALGQVGVGGPIPVGSIECSNCHSEDPDLCVRRFCDENTVCVPKEGEFDDGTLWVSVHCIGTPA